MFNPTLIWAAFEVAGLLVDVTYQPASGDPVLFKAGFLCPDATLFDGAAQETDFSIEYKSQDVTLPRGAALSITGCLNEAMNGSYKVRHTPGMTGDGFFSTAYLERA